MTLQTERLRTVEQLRAFVEGAEASFLRDGVTFDDLDRTASAQSDLQAARALKRARDGLFRKIHGIVPAAA